MPHKAIKALIDHIHKKHLGFCVVTRNQLMSVNIPKSNDFEIFRAPQFVFYSRHQNGRNLNRKDWFERVPDLCLDISDYFEGANAAALRMLRCGATAVFYLDRALQRIHMYQRGNRITVLEKRDTFQHPTLLPGFHATVGDLLPELNPEPDPPKKTLFDPISYPPTRRPGKLGQTYASWIRCPARDSDALFTSQELSIFRNLAESEIPINEDFLRLQGSLKVKVGNQELDLSKREWNAFGWVEADRVQFQGCGAKGILRFEKGTTFHGVKQSGGAKKLNMILANGYGIPRTNARRLLHRIAEKFNLPVYIIADNDTWGYFMFSVLKRGTVAPFHSVPELSIPNLRYLGVRAGDLAGIPNAWRYFRSWKKRWDIRLRALSKYDCFSSKEWQHEFEKFERQEGALETEGLLFGLHRSLNVNGPVFNAYKSLISHYIAKKLNDKLWLE